MVRVDKWLWAARLAKTRALAAEAVKGGRVEINGQRVKPSKEVRPGDEIEITTGPYRRVVIVQALAERRGPAKAEALPYEEAAESVAARLDVLAGRVRQGEHAARALLGGLDEALVLQLRQRRVDGAGARAPDALAALLDLLHQRVAVARLLGEEQQDGGADVAARGAAAAGAEGRAEARPEARPEATRAPGAVAVAAVMAHPGASLLPHGWTAPLVWICHCSHGGPFIRSVY